MKTRNVLLLVLIFAFFISSAQSVPNGNLETWTSSPYSPDGWTSLEDFIPPITGTGLSYKDSIDKYEGMASIRLQSKYVAFADDTVPGILSVGTGAFGANGPELNGTPFTSSPDTLRFAYKFEPVGNDTANVKIILHKAGGGEKLNYGQDLQSTNGQWLVVTIPLKQYYSDTTGTPDSLLLKFQSSVLGDNGSTNHPRVGSILHVDAVYFGYEVHASGSTPNVFTLGHDPITGHDFNFYGAVNTNGDSAGVRFVYSTDSTFATSNSTPAQMVTNNSLGIVYATVTSLTANSTYFYYLKATNNQGTATGEIKKFYSDTISTIFANDGADVYPGTAFAQLNGRISGFHTAVNLFFEIGETPMFGKQIVPDVASVSDSLTHYFRAYPDSLVAGKLYFFRVKAVSATDSFYTDTRGAYTGTGVYSVFQTLAATNVTDSSADFNGQAQGFQQPLKLKVEIFSPALGHYHSPYEYHAPNPALINYTRHKGGLQPNTLYSTRFKAETWIGNIYSDSSFTTTGPVGIGELSMANAITVYPNPSNGLVIVKMPAQLKDESIVGLYNISGQLVNEWKVSAGTGVTTFSSTDMAAGSYLLKWMNGVNLVYKKIVITK